MANEGKEWLRYPLEGVRVIGLEQFIAGPYTTMLLADEGADVIKIEQPKVGDPRRNFPPFAYSQDGRRCSGGFMSFNRNKKSMTLDLRNELGKQVFLDLVKVSDVVVENLRPGAMDRLGLGYEMLQEQNPRLVYAMISGFGRLKSHRGPYSDWPTFDVVAEAMGGISHLVGYEDGPPLLTIYGFADMYGAMVAVYSIMLALFTREHTGRGQVVDVALYDSMVSLNERMVMTYSFTGESPHRGRERQAAPRSIFRCKDGYIALNTPNNDMWTRLMKVIGREDLIDHQYTKSGPSRALHSEDFIRPILEGWLADKTKQEAIELIMKGGVPAGPVQTVEDLTCCPQLKARNMLLEIEDPIAGKRIMARSPVRMSNSPEVPTRTAPALGEHTEQILSQLLGYDARKIAELRKAEAI